ncbi:MAG: hypothetical protein EWM47_00855, partial [Anaerolineaceae bacterium]
MQKEVNALNNDKDKQRADNKQQPMKYQQFFPGPPFGPPDQRPPGQGMPPGQRPPSPPGQRPGRPGGPP